MDPTLYKSIVVKRGFQYQYLYAVAQESKPTLLFLHGFPSSSYDWHLQVEFFRAEGHGIIVPDMLGSGKTSRPLDPEAFRLNAVAADIIEILDKEHIKAVVGVGHDWGCVILSRLSMLHASRFQAFVWLGLTFVKPATANFDLDTIMALLKEVLGHEGYSYWKFFIQDNAAAIIEQNIDSFLQLLYPKDPSIWNTYMALPGKTAEWMNNNMKPGFPSYLSEQDIQHIRTNILAGGVKSSLNWYLSHVNNVSLRDNLNIPEENWFIKHPSMFAASLKDCVNTLKLGRAALDKYGTNVTVVEFDTGHWLHLECPDKLNTELLAWIKALNLCT